MKFLDGLTLDEAKKLISSNNGLELDSLIDFLASFSEIINPNSNLSLLYPLAGYDVFTPLLTANPSPLVMVEKDPISECKNKSPEAIRSFLRDEFPRGWACECETQGTIYPKILTELYLLGVNLDDVSFKNDKDLTKINLSWKHPKSENKKPYEILIINDYLDTVKDKPLEKYQSLPSFDALLFKAYNDLIFKNLISSMTKNGLTVISDCLDNKVEEMEGALDVNIPQNLIRKGLSLRDKGYRFGYDKNNNCCPIICRIQATSITQS